MQSDGTYRKHNSFVELRSRHNDALQSGLSRIAFLQSSDVIKKDLSERQLEVLDKVFNELFSDTTEKTRSRFTLTPNVAEEIATIADVDLPRYLVHRYRYEIYPELRVLDDFPPYLQIEPSSLCNYRCIFCFETDSYFTRKSNGFMGYMTFDTFKNVIDQAAGNIEFISLASRGEPLLCPEIENMLAYTRDKFLNLKMNTNASILDERKAHAILQSGIKTLVFSADASEEPLYSQLRVNGCLERVLANIERFQKIRYTQYAGSKIITRVSGVKFDDRQDLDEMQRFWGELVDQVAFVNYNPWENVYESAVSGVNKPCSDLWRRMFVWWDGKVNPCDVDYRSTLSIGSLSDGDLSTLWRAKKYEDLRLGHASSQRAEHSPCNHCTFV